MIFCDLSIDWSFLRARSSFEPEDFAAELKRRNVLLEAEGGVGGIQRCGIARHGAIGYAYFSSNMTHPRTPLLSLDTFHDMEGPGGLAVTSRNWLGKFVRARPAAHICCYPGQVPPDDQRSRGPGRLVLLSWPTWTGYRQPHWVRDVLLVSSENNPSPLFHALSYYLIQRARVGRVLQEITDGGTLK